MNLRLPLLLCLLLPFLPPSTAGATPELQAFPGAQGAGSGAVGGRGGQVYVVTNLDDSGPGSLREALEAEGPRIVVFAVGGRIWLDSRIELLNPYVTVAGQTAPGGGIELANAANQKAPLRIRTHDVVIRNLRSRPGPGGDRDALSLYGSEDVHHVMLDHLSLSWAVDENFGVFGDARDVTLQWSIVSEPLECSTHPAGCLGNAILLDGGLRFSLHHNLLAHARERMPRVAGSGVFDFVNNLIYNPGFTGNWGPMHVEHGEGMLSRVNVVGNRYVPGVDSGSADWYVDGRNSFQVYAADNDVPGALIRPGQEDHLVFAPHPVTRPVFTQAPQQAADAVLAADGAGAWMGIACDGSLYSRRDPVDARIVADVAAGTGTVIDDPSEVGGWPPIDPGTPCADGDGDGLPDAWEDAHGSDPLDPTGIHGAHGDVDGDCYTNIESWFNPMVDSDGDGVDDPFDTCPVHPDGQLDADGDGYGNVCDADFDQDGVAAASDFLALISRMGQDCSHPAYDPAYDLDAPASCATGCDPAACVVGGSDFVRLLALFGREPGPGRGCWLPAPSASPE